MDLGDRVHKHKVKLNKYTNSDTLGPMQKKVIPKYHMSMTSNFNVIRRCVQIAPNQVNVDSDQNKQVIKTHKRIK